MELPPLPQTPTKQQHKLTRDQRLRIQTLFFDAHWSRADIVLQTGYSYDQEKVNRMGNGIAREYRDPLD
ncbi:hypothetical protein BP5796_08665 [Coleophoma crateriformis]|uniref:Uncharacterized protein n=1 Tax=Coleophoma crateriformis TaxID=565419 RepID=A0A3D8R8P3_9HELO|nr:hypothetical protein BP5796_08665 [Coleophoma crateriformis]